MGRKMEVWCDNSDCKYCVQERDYYVCGVPEEEFEGIQIDRQGRCTVFKKK